MFRIAQPGDLPALCGLMKTAFGDEAEFTEMMAARFAGWKNVYVAQREDGAVEAMLCAVPVTLRGKPGAYFYALCTAPESRGQGLMTGLMDYAADALRAAGARLPFTKSGDSSGRLPGAPLPARSGPICGPTPSLTRSPPVRCCSCGKSLPPIRCC